MPTQKTLHQQKTTGAGKGARKGFMDNGFLKPNTENVCSPSLKQNTSKCSLLSLMSREPSVTSRLSKISKWLSIAFPLCKESLRSSNPAAGERSLSRARYVWKHPVLADSLGCKPEVLPSESSPVVNFADGCSDA